MERLDGVGDAEVMSLDTGETLILPEKDRSFDPAQIRKAVQGAGFSADRVEVVVRGTLKTMEGLLALRVPGFERLFFLEGGEAVDELKMLENDTQVSVSGAFHAPEGGGAPRLTVEKVR